MSETNQEREIRKLREEVYGLTKVLRKLTGVIEKTVEPEPAPKEPPAACKGNDVIIKIREGCSVTMIQGMEPIVEMTVKAAVATLRDFCQNVEKCDDDCCPIYPWCIDNTPDDGSEPRRWKAL